jgi:ABC-type antimicrobial peptide transport system permease subunit
VEGLIVTGNGGKYSQPSLPAVCPSLDTTVDLEERIEAIEGLVRTTIVKQEVIRNSLERLERKLETTHRDILSLRSSVEVIEQRTADIPAIKKLLIEALCGVK